MAQNITVQGASYADVPAVVLPKTGGGTASFTDVSDTTAAAADVASGKYFYTAAGVKTEGTASGGGGGSVDWDDVIAKTYQYGDVVLDTVTTWTDLPIFKGTSGITGFKATATTTAGTTGSSILFEGCANLVYAFFPEATTVGRDAVRRCDNLEYFAAPKMTTIGNESFRQNYKMKAVDLGLITALPTRTFYGAFTSTVDVILRSSTVASIEANAVPAGAGAHVYVPSSLISTYEQTTNWSTGVNNGTVTFYALEGSPYESTTWWQSV